MFEDFSNSHNETKIKEKKSDKENIVKLSTEDLIADLPEEWKMAFEKRSIFMKIAQFKEIYSRLKLVQWKDDDISKELQKDAYNDLITYLEKMRIEYPEAWRVFLKWIKDMDEVDKAQLYKTQLRSELKPYITEIDAKE